MMRCGDSADAKKEEEEEGTEVFIYWCFLWGDTSVTLVSWEWSLTPLEWLRNSADVAILLFHISTGS